MDKLSTRNKGISFVQLITLVIVIGLLAAFLIPFIGDYFKEKGTLLHSTENLQFVSSRLQIKGIV